jgi:uncharacterized membrane protein
MNDDFLTTRHWIVALSSVGAANMALGSLRQLGLIQHLPDPPIHGFDSNAVLTSRQATALGVPDAPVAMLGLLANIPLSLAGGRDRTRIRPWLPIAIAAKAVVEVSVAAWYLTQMRTQLHLWCAYCLVGATIFGAIAVLALPEANAALPDTRARAAAVAAAMLLVGAAFGAMHYLNARTRA